jgi:hypothetical protein
MILVFSPMLKAQKSHTGIKAGLNLSSLTTDGNNDKNLKVGIMAGVYNKMALTNSFAIQPELLFSSNGIKYNYNDNTFADGNTKFNLSYIQLPVKLVFNLSPDFEFQLGPYLGYLVSANVNTDATVLDYFNINSQDEIDRKNFNALDVGLTGGLGFDLDPLIIGFNYNIGLNPVAKKDEISRDMLGDAKNAVIQVYAGIHF